MAIACIENGNYSESVLRHFGQQGKIHPSIVNFLEALLWDLQRLVDRECIFYIRNALMSCT